MPMDELSGETILRLVQDIKNEIKQDLLSVKADIRSDIQQLVTKDVFDAEMRHHQDQHRLMEEKQRDDIARLTTALADSEARAMAAAAENEAATNALKADLEQSEKQRQSERKKTWTALGGTILSLMMAVSAIVSAIANLHH